MYKFFTQKKWFKWSILGSLFILISTWYQVQLDVKINEWFGDFYDTLQKALTTPNSVSEAEFIGYLFIFAKIAALWILIAVFTGFFTSHWVFRWRTAMANYFHDLLETVEKHSHLLLPCLITCFGIIFGMYRLSQKTHSLHQ